HPRGEGGPPLEPAKPTIGAQKSLLGQVIGQTRIPAQPQQQPANLGLMPPQQLTECRPVAVRGPPHELCVLHLEGRMRRRLRRTRCERGWKNERRHRCFSPPARAKRSHSRYPAPMNSGTKAPATSPRSPKKSPAAKSPRPANKSTIPRR